MQRCSCMATFAALICWTANCHSILRWPEPRNRNPSNRRLTGSSLAQSACGSRPPAIETNAPTIKPGMLTVWISEAIRMEGSSWRLELGTEDSDKKSCVLLDHIPHNIDSGNPIYGDESTWNNYFISVRIPNVDCGEKGCSLLLFRPRAQAASCRNGGGDSGPPPQCDAVYYSCSKPLRFSGTEKRIKFPTAGESCWKGKDVDHAVIKADDGRTISWINPDNLESAITFRSNVYRRETALWARELLFAGFRDEQVDAQVRLLNGPAAASYKRRQAEADAKARGPNTDLAPSAGISAVGVVLAVLQCAAVAFPLIWFMVLKRGSARVMHLWKSVPMKARVFGLLGIRLLEVLLCFVSLFVVGTSVLVTTGPAYVMVTTALLMVYCATPFSAAGAIVALWKWDDKGCLFASLDKFQKSIGAHAIEVVLWFLFTFAAAVSGFVTSAVAGLTCTVLVLEMFALPVVLLYCYEARLDEDSDKHSEDGGKDGRSGSSNANDNDTADNANADLPPAQEPPLAAAPVIRVAEYDYTKQRADELSFCEGDRIQVVNERSDGWAKGILIDSEDDPKPQGMFPINYTAQA